MPLSASDLGDELKTAVDGAMFDAPAANPGESGAAYRARLIALQNDNREKALDALAEAIVDHITKNAVVTGVCPSMGGPLGSGTVT